MPTAAKINPALTILKAARKRLAERGGWAQVTPKGDKPRGGECADNVLSAVCRPFADRHVVAARKHLCAAIGETSTERAAIWAWNDKPSRKKAEVLAAFDRAIKQAAAVAKTRKVPGIKRANSTPNAA